MSLLSRYQPLVDFLAGSAAAAVVLAFPEIEAIIGGELPPSAYGNATYWSGTQYAAGRALHGIGWQGRIDRRNHRVHFTRAAGDG